MWTLSRFSQYQRGFKEVLRISGFIKTKHLKGIIMLYYGSSATFRVRLHETRDEFHPGTNSSRGEM